MGGRRDPEQACPGFGEAKKGLEWSDLAVNEQTFALNLFISLNRICEPLRELSGLGEFGQPPVGWGGSRRPPDHMSEKPQLVSLGGETSSAQGTEPCQTLLMSESSDPPLSVFLRCLSSSCFSALCCLFIVLNPSPGSCSSLLSLWIYVAVHFKRPVSSACSPEFELHSFTSSVSRLPFPLGQI